MGSLQRLYKRAVKVAGLPVQPDAAAPAPAVTTGQMAAAKQLLKLLGLGVAGGVAYRSLQGFSDVAKPPPNAAGPGSNIPYQISVYGKPGPYEEERTKRADDAATDGGWGGTLQKLLNDARQIPVTKTLASMLPHPTTVRPLANEWGMPAATLVAGAGLYGGYKGVDWLLGKEKQRASQKAVQNAEEDYHNAIAEQYRAAMMGKQAGDDLGINNLADQYLETGKTVDPGMRKQAIIMSALGHYWPDLDKMYSNLYFGHDTYQGLKGGVNTAALLAALGGGKLTYDWAKQQAPQDILQKAIQHRQRLRQQSSPVPIVAVPEEDDGPGKWIAG